MTNWFDILYKRSRPVEPETRAMPEIPDVAGGELAADAGAPLRPPPRRVSAEALEPPPPLPAMPSRWVLELQKAAFHLEHEAAVVSGARVVAFSAMQPRGGTSTVSYLLAHYLAAETPNTRVLFIDFSMDAKRGGIKGADHVFRVGEPVPEDFLVSNPLSFSRVSVRPGDDDSVVNRSRWFRDLLDVSRQYCDWVIVDVPPFFSSPESYSVSQLCDGTVLVLKSGATRYPALNGLVGDLEQVGIHVLGVVMNFREYPIPRWLLKYI